MTTVPLFVNWLTGQPMDIAAAPSFIQSGTGAVARTWQSKVGDVFNVRDFGAKGDGTTNDTTAIFNAIAALPAAGGTLYFPAGVYMVDPDNLVLGNGTDSVVSTRNGISLRGEGGLQFANTSGTTIKARSSGTALLTMAGEVNGLRISDMLFDCAGLVQFGWQVFSINNCAFTNFAIVNWTNIGILGNCRHYGPGAVGYSSNNTFMQFEITSQVAVDFGSAIVLDGFAAQNYDWFRNVFIDGQCQTNKGSVSTTFGINLKFCDHNTFVNVEAFSSGSGAGGFIGANFDGTNAPNFPLNNFFFGCQIANTSVTGTILTNHFVCFATRDSEVVPTDPNLIGFTDRGQIFGAHSFRDALTVSSNLSMQTVQMTLANGLNSNIALPAGSRVRINGPTAGFSVGGFASPVDGMRLHLFNSTAQQMTIVQEDLSSTAANRIATLTGANVVLRAGTSFCTMAYDSSYGRWICESFN